jgi:hypothetical protein
VPPRPEESCRALNDLAISCGPWRLPASLREKLIKIGGYDHYVTFQMAEVAVPRQMFQEILLLMRISP